MFKGAELFDQPLDQWNLNTLVSYKDMFKGSGLSKENWGIMEAKAAWAKIKQYLGLPDDY